MKKTVLFLLLLLVLTLSACGIIKSRAAIDAENAIKAIGEVTLDSEAAIKNAEKMYSVLTDDEKALVTNRLDLVNAREAYDKLASDTCKKLAQSVLYELDNAGQMCSINVGYIGKAWHFGIYGDSNGLMKYFHEDDEIIEYYANEVGVSETMVEDAINKLGYLPGFLYNDSNAGNAYQWCVFTAIQILEDANLYEPCKDLMILATQQLKEIRDKFPNYEYLTDLELYFGVVNNFYEFTKSPSGSYSSLSGTVSGFKNDMQTYSVKLGSKINTGK